MAFKKIKRELFEELLDRLDGDTQVMLDDELKTWDEGDTCDKIMVILDRNGNLDYMSSPRPG